MTHTIHTDLGELISLFFEEFMKLYGDRELAAVATAAAIQELLIEEAGRGGVVEDAA